MGALRCWLDLYHPVCSLTIAFAADYRDDGPGIQEVDYPIFAALTVAILATLAYFLVYRFSRRDWMYYPLPFAIMTAGILHYLFLILLARPVPSNQYSPRQ